MITQEDLRRAIEGDEIPTNGKPFSSKRLYAWTAKLCLKWMEQNAMEERSHVGPFGAVEPWKKGDELVIKKGAQIWVNLPLEPHTLVRRQKITVFRFQPGAAWEDKGPLVRHPRLVYVGAGRQYREVEPSQVEMRLQTLHDKLHYQALVA